MWQGVVTAVAGGLVGAVATHWWGQHGPGQEPAATERHRLARAHQQRMHWELLSMAIDDPDLAAVIDTFEVDMPPEKRRQMIYANLWYINAYHLYESGLLNRHELLGHLRELFQSPYIREYWEITRHHRAALDPSSSEAEIGRIAEALFQELDDADTDEWWVVGGG
ncbi:DUF6082 family protein [Streptomyces sp. VRA16 Mangrove soil]|uniref:DUF6082 family protein n=1 Tax=Streptomyces sp. VRA16 Mangrove soil TaxID=2817434 RepID=UPI001A9EF097|nr:DUF6082 family protein [Streptomyces sp. VRA16 Mangrove soil]MBO1335762.1 hypothetical protein [Streptomyces sp. VRA16 Mangrove soil]